MGFQIQAGPVTWNEASPLTLEGASAAEDANTVTEAMAIMITSLLRGNHGGKLCPFEGLSMS